MKNRSFPVENIYPTASHHFGKKHVRILMRNLCLLTAYVCVLVNAIVGGFVWSVIVLGALMVAWVAFLYRPMLENTLIKKLCNTLTAVCLFLILLDDVLGTSWAYFVVPIVFWGNLLIIGLLFVIFFRKQKRNCMPLFEAMTAGMAVTVLTLLIFGEINWPFIVLGSVSLGMMVLFLILYWSTLRFEFRKRWHV